jgi:beta-lactam-binding protein with PASTA domain
MRRDFPDKAPGFAGSEAELAASPFEEMSRYTTIATSAALVLACSACGGGRARPVPNVTGLRLDVAENTLDAKDFRYRTIGGGAFGIVARSHWVVCRQNPTPRTVSTNLTLYVARSCPARSTRAVPDVVGAELDYAEITVHQAGLQVRTESVDGDPIILKSHWLVCDQSPEAGKRAKAVELYVAHDWNECDEDW